MNIALRIASQIFFVGHGKERHVAVVGQFHLPFLPFLLLLCEEGPLLATGNVHVGDTLLGKYLVVSVGSGGLALDAAVFRVGARLFVVEMFLFLLDGLLGRGKQRRQVIDARVGGVQVPQGVVVRLRGRPYRFGSLSSQAEIPVVSHVLDVHPVGARGGFQSPSLRVPESRRRQIGRVDLPVGIGTQEFRVVRPAGNIKIAVSDLDEPKDLPSVRFAGEGELPQQVASELAVDHGIGNETQFSRVEFEGPDGTVRIIVFAGYHLQFFFRSVRAV
mmetsp:Transcript_25324/g.54015  ORF Transcript_25324/g.54015 Transcript_25324/m.54015 type:complete len:274 (+) Transcript_25324:2656-3477(+)